MTRVQKLLVFLTLGVIGLSFLPVLQNGFIQSDDSVYLVNNPLIRDLSWHGIQNIFGSTFRVMYQPLVLFSFLLEYPFFGPDPMGYHAVNLLIHLLNAYLVFRLLSKLSGNFSVSLLAALFFGIHPLQVESVAYIAERKDMLYAVFFLGSLVFYLHHFKNKKFYALSLIFFILSLLAKPAGVLLPLVLFAFDFLKKRKWDRSAFLDKIPFLAIAVFFGILGIMNQQKDGREMIPLFPQWAAYSYQSVLFYLSKIWAPGDLSFLYPLSAVNSAGFYGVWITLALVLYLKNSRDAIFALLFFLITLIPGLQIIPINLFHSRTPVFDHYVYIPIIGMLYLAALFIMTLYQRSGRRVKVFICIFLSLLVIGSGMLTWKRCYAWKDGLTIYADALKKYPDCERAKTCFDHLLYYRDSVSQFSEEIRKDPKNAELYYNRAVFHSMPDAGTYQKALEDYDRAIALDPSVAEFYLNRGSIYQEQHLHEKALADYEQVARLKPELTQAHFNRALLFEKMGQKEKALESYRIFLETISRFPEKNNEPGVQKAAARARQKISS